MTKRHSSQHKATKRECPNCHEDKVFPDRNETCSPECATAFKKQSQGNSAPGSDETHEIHGNAWDISLRRTRIHTLPELLDFFKVDLGEWEVQRFVVNKWEVGRKAKDENLAWVDGVVTGYVRDTGKIFVEPLYQVKAWLRRKVLQIGVREELDEMKRFALDKAPVFKMVKRVKRSPSGNMLELSIPDLHIGKLAWGQETGWTDYDVRIAEAMFDRAVEALVERTNSYVFDEIVFVVGNDLLNTNNADQTTAAGTAVSSDSRFHKTFRIAREMITRAIERLRQIAPVRVVVVPGNHDLLAAWHLGDSLECYFHKCADVTIENDPTTRKYYQWGKVMLMWAHKSQKGKRDDYPLLMATERSEMFGVTTFREVHTGDLHQVRLEETHGIRVRILPALCAPDDWHSEHGFVGNIQSAEAYIWNKDEGLIGTAVYTVPDQMPAKQ